MKRILSVSALICVFISCQKSLYWPDEPANNIIALENARLDRVITDQIQKTWLNGQVLNEQNQPIAGATVICGAKTAVTDNDGFYRFKELLEVNKDYALIKVEKAGYMSGFRTFTPNPREVTYRHEKIVLQATPASQVVASTGGIITADNIKLTFPADAVVRTDGSAYSGNVNVMMRYIDPSASNFDLMMPGTLAGLNTNDQINAMQSFGMANVELKDNTGQKLEIAPGKTVRMEMPASATAPATIPLWHFNEDYGVWVQQGIANKQGNIYVAEVNHFSIWNLDVEFNDFVLNLKFQINDSTPLSNQLVSVFIANDSGFVKTIYTDNAGEATLINCPSNESMVLKLSFVCDTIVHQLAPLTQSRFDTITVAGPQIKNYQLEGNITGCNNQLLIKQPFEMMITGSNGNFIVLNGITDNNGGYNIGTSIPVCVSGNFEVQTIALIDNQYSFSNTTAIVEGLNNYNPVLCSTATNTVTLQPANNPTELNFAGFQSGANLSAHLKELCAGTWTNNSEIFYMRGALKFDLSSIPSGATIVSAKLTLYSIPDPQNGDQINANSGTDNSMFIQRITQDWTGASTWLTQPSTTTANQVSIPHTTQNFLDLEEVNVTAMVRDMHTLGNYGFQMRLQNEVIYNVRQFASSVHINTAKHPKLVIAYQ